MHRLTPLTLMLAGCVSWGNLPEQDNHWLDGDLWAPSQAVASTHGVYVPLTQAGGVALVTQAQGGSAQRVDIGEGRVTQLSVAPNQETVVAFVERYTCDYEGDDKPPELVQDCDDLVAETELSVLDGTKIFLTSAGSPPVRSVEQ